MPKEIHNVKDFILLAKGDDARFINIKKTKGVTKFKVRCSKYLYTLRVSDHARAEKLRQALPTGLTVKEL